MNISKEILNEIEMIGNKELSNNFIKIFSKKAGYNISLDMYQRFENTRKSLAIAQRNLTAANASNIDNQINHMRILLFCTLEELVKLEARLQNNKISDLAKLSNDKIEQGIYEAFNHLYDEMVLANAQQPNYVVVILLNLFMTSILYGLNHNTQEQKDALESVIKENTEIYTEIQKLLNLPISEAITEIVSRIEQEARNS